MPPTPEIKGWCPSAHAPMASGDGLLIRARTFGSRVSAAQLRAIASISADCGNGLVDLTQRAQLQLRGLSEATLDEARRRLDERGLLANDAQAELHVVVGPPAWGPNAGFDAIALMQDIERQGGAQDAELRALPAKFLISIDAGALYSLADVAADIRIEAIDKFRAAVGVDGAPDCGAVVAAPNVAAITIRLARAFVALRAARFELRRMRHLVAALGLDALLREAGVTMQTYRWRAPGSVRSILGARPLGGGVAVGVGAPFGRWRALELSALADIADEIAIERLHLTHWRAVLLVAPDGVAAQNLLRAAQALNLMISPDDPRLSVVACPGAPECSQAQGETRRLATRLSQLAQKLAGADGVGLHVSGCAKGCARAASAPVTLVASGQSFDLIDNGAAADAPVLKGLSIDGVERALISRAEDMTCPTP